MTADPHVLVHPDDDPADRTARRLMARATTHGDWPWMRVTGPAVDIPHRGDPLTHWQPQSLHDYAEIMEPRLAAQT